MRPNIKEAPQGLAELICKHLAAFPALATVLPRQDSDQVANGRAPPVLLSSQSIVRDVQNDGPEKTKTVPWAQHQSFQHWQDGKAVLTQLPLTDSGPGQASAQTGQ